MVGGEGPLQRRSRTGRGVGQRADYIDKNRSRMRYRDFRARGLRTGSGVVESFCKRIVGSRLKQSGMRWTFRGGQCHLGLALLRYQRQLRGLLGSA